PADFAGPAAIEAVVDLLAALRPVDVFELRPIFQVFLDSHFRVDRHAPRQVADVLPHLHRLRADVEAGDVGGAARRGQVAGEDLKRGRLAGAVGAEEADDLALRDLE